MQYRLDESAVSEELSSGGDDTGSIESGGIVSGEQRYSIIFHLRQVGFENQDRQLLI